MDTLLWNMFEAYFTIRGLGFLPLPGGMYLQGASAFLPIIVQWIVIWILLVVSRWMLFQKAGEKGWKSLIPFYGDYIQWRLGWKRTACFFISAFLVLVGGVMLVDCIRCLPSQLLVDAYISFDDIQNQGTLLPLMTGLIFVIAGYVVHLVSIYKLIKSFGESPVFFILYLITPSLIFPVLGFGSSEYQGSQE